MKTPCPVYARVDDLKVAGGAGVQIRIERYAAIRD